MATLVLDELADNPGWRHALSVTSHLRALGYSAYLVGGCVRDILLGRLPEDFDVATNARPDVVLNAFSRTFAVGAHFGVVLVAEGESHVTEVATFRSDGAYSDGRRPDTVLFSDTPQQDVARRDFTINGLMLDPLLWVSGGSLHEAVLDLVGGQADLHAGILRAIGEPAQRFAEDHLRMLRAVRFAARLGFELVEGTRQAIKDAAPYITAVSCERIRDELTRMLTGGHADRALRLMDETGLLQPILPELVAMKGVEQPPQFHPEGDVWQHTLKVMSYMEAGADPRLAWGALLHDVGKPATFRRAPDRIRFDGHVEMGSAISRQILARMRFSFDDTAQILALVENHMRFGDVLHMKESTLKRFFRLPGFEQHLALHRMDALSSLGQLDLYDYARVRYSELAQEEVKPALLVTGRSLLRIGYRAGPHFRLMLELAEDAQLEGRISNEEEGLRLITEKFGLPTA